MFSASVGEEFVRQMGYTHREFYRNLPYAMKDLNYRLQEPDRVFIEFENGSISITLGVPKDRRIANLSLPYMDVHFKFEHLNAEQRKRFYNAFERSYQKGGG